MADPGKTDLNATRNALMEQQRQLREQQEQLLRQQQEQAQQMAQQRQQMAMYRSVVDQQTKQQTLMGRVGTGAAGALGFSVGAAQGFMGPFAPSNYLGGGMMRPGAASALQLSGGDAIRLGFSVPMIRQLEQMLGVSSPLLARNAEYSVALQGRVSDFARASMGDAFQSPIGEFVGDSGIGAFSRFLGLDRLADSVFEVTEQERKLGTIRALEFTDRDFKERIGAANEFGRVDPNANVVGMINAAQQDLIKSYAESVGASVDDPDFIRSASSLMEAGNRAFFEKVAYGSAGDDIQTRGELEDAYRQEMDGFLERMADMGKALMMTEEQINSFISSMQEMGVSTSVAVDTLEVTGDMVGVPSAVRNRMAMSAAQDSASAGVLTDDLLQDRAALNLQMRSRIDAAVGEGILDADRMQAFGATSAEQAQRLQRALRGSGASQNLNELLAFGDRQGVTSGSLQERMGQIAGQLADDPMALLRYRFSEEGLRDAQTSLGGGELVEALNQINLTGDEETDQAIRAQTIASTLGISNSEAAALAALDPEALAGSEELENALAGMGGGGAGDSDNPTMDRFTDGVSSLNATMTDLVNAFKSRAAEDKVVKKKDPEPQPSSWVRDNSGMNVLRGSKM